MINNHFLVRNYIASAKISKSAGDVTLVYTFNLKIGREGQVFLNFLIFVVIIKLTEKVNVSMMLES
jgi:hypothetical protein